MGQGQVNIFDFESADIETLSISIREHMSKLRHTRAIRFTIPVGGSQFVVPGPGLFVGCVCLNATATADTLQIVDGAAADQRYVGLVPLAASGPGHVDVGTDGYAFTTGLTVSAVGGLVAVAGQIFVRTHPTL